MQHRVFSVLVLAAAVVLAIALAGCSSKRQVQSVQYTLTISVSPTEGGSVIPPSGIKYNPGTVVFLTPTPNSGYAFSHWSGPDPVVTEAGTHRIVMTKNTSVTAVFAKLSYEVQTTVSPAEAGNVSLTVIQPAAVLQDSIKHGETVQLTARANPGYTFAYWEGALTGTDNPGTVYIDGPKSVTAVFAPHKIAFCASDASGNWDIWVFESYGYFRRLTTDLARDERPAWSPDRTRLAFMSLRDGNYEIYTMNADGSNQTRLTSNPGSDEYPTWSPDGTKITFKSDRDGQSGYYVMNADGSGQIGFTTPPATDGRLVWSPNGSKIAFARYVDGNSEIHVMNIDGTGLTRLTYNSVGDGAPCWSPDGTKIAFSSDGDICIMNADGTNQRNFTNSGSDGSPAWYTGGTKIAYISFSQLYVMNSDGTDQTLVNWNPYGGHYSLSW